MGCPHRVSPNAADSLRLPSVGVGSEFRSQSHFSGALPGRLPALGGLGGRTGWGNLFPRSAHRFRGL